MSNYRIEKHTNDEIISYRFENDEGYCHLIPSPFANCQMFGIEWAEWFIWEKKRNSMKSARKAFLHMYYLTRKYQVIIDVGQDTWKSLNLILKPFIEEVETMPYISTNGSRMTICRIVLKKSLNDLIIANNYNFENFEYDE